MAISFNLVSGLLPPLMDHGDTFSVMFGTLLMQAPQLLHKMTEG